MLASLCVILYSMMILECWRRCCSVGRSRCWSMVVTLACLLKLCMMCLAERRCTVSSLWILEAVAVYTRGSLPQNVHKVFVDQQGTSIYRFYG